MNSDYKTILKKWSGSLILLPFYFYYGFKKGEFTFIDNLNLLIHEGGHGIFRLFGDFIYTLGGTLMQIIIPILCLWYAVSNKKRFIIQLSILWLGQSLMNISVYATDARERILPLLGGNKVYHDWHWMLSRLNLLEYDDVIGLIFYLSGIGCFIISFLIPVIYKEYEHVDIELKL